MAETAVPVVASRVPDLAALGLDVAGPLLLVDVDEVLGLFMAGVGRFAATRGLEMRIDRFALFQNIYPQGSDQHIGPEEGRGLLADFFRFASCDIEPAPGAAAALRELSGHAGVFIVSNAPGQGRLGRARWLGRHGLDYPLVLNNGPKGPIAAALAAQVQGPVAFVDDLLPNLNSVADAAPRIARFQMVADPQLRLHAPSDPERHARIDDWPDLKLALEAAIRAPVGEPA